jgi:predicted dehydrogenase
MTKAKQWRVGIIGAGTVVTYGHIPNFQSIDNVEVVALCDVNQARVQEVAAEHGIPHAYTDYREMLTKDAPDIVVVATPNIFHKPMTLDALNAGAHVLCEKPMALHYADAEEMMAMAKEKGLVLTVGTHYRYSDPVQACKAHVDDGFLGKVYAARTSWQRRHGIPGYGSWFTNQEMAGGGALLDIGIHALDRALYLMGYPKPVRVVGATFAEFGPRGEGLFGWGVDGIDRGVQGVRFDVDDLTWAQVQFEDGSVLHLNVAWATHAPEEFRTQLYGTEGGMLLDGFDKYMLYQDLNGKPVDITPEPPYGSGVSSYRRLVENFVRHLDGDPDAELIPPEEALIGARIIDGILRSAESGREVAL